MIFFADEGRSERVMLNWTRAELATFAGISPSTVRDFEGQRHQLHRSTEALLIRTLEKAGVRLLPPGRERAGARLCKHRPFLLPPYVTAHERSEEHTPEIQSLMRTSYAVFCFKKKPTPYTTSRPKIQSAHILTTLTNAKHIVHIR